METEIVLHFIMMLILLMYISKLWRCLSLGRNNFDASWATTDDKMHLIDHILGALLSTIGALFTVVLLFIELVGHILGDAAQLHSAIDIGLCVTLAGAAYIAWHLEREEDPNHPFFHWRSTMRQYQHDPRVGIKQDY